MDTNQFKVIFKYFLVIASVFFIFAAGINAQTPKPLVKENLLRSIETGKTAPDKIDAKRYIELINKYGINWKLTPEDESEIRLVGQYLGETNLNDLIAAIRKNYKLVAPVAERPNKLTILVAKFGDKNAQNDIVTDLIISQLEESTKKYSNVTVIPLNEHITAGEGRKVAINKGKAKNADLVLWGWYKKDKTNVIISYQIENIFNFTNDFTINTSKPFVEEIPNFNLSAQLQISKDIAFLTLVSLALINNELGKFDNSIKYISDAIAYESTSNRLIDLPQLYILRAKWLLNKTCGFGVNEVLSDINTAIKLGANPKSPLVLQILADAYLPKDDEKSLDYAKSYNQIAVTNEDKTISLFQLTEIYTNRDEIDLAEEFAEKLINHLLVLPESYENYIYLGFASYIKKDKPSAIKYLTKAHDNIRLDNSNIWRSYHLLGLIYGSDEGYKLAIDSFRKSIDSNPTCIPSHTLLAQAYRLRNHKGDNDTALIIYNQALKINTNIAQAYIGKGQIYEKVGNDQEALANYQKAVDVDINYAEAHRFLGRFYRKTNKIDDAIDSFSKLLKLKKADKEALATRASLYLIKEKFDLALTDFRSLFSFLPKKPSEGDKFRFKYLYQLFHDEFIQSRNYESGIEISKLYIEFLPKDSEGYAKLADFLEIKGDIKSAIENLEKAIVLSTDPFLKKKYESQLNRLRLQIK